MEMIWKWAPVLVPLALCGLALVGMAASVWVTDYYRPRRSRRRNGRR